MVVKDRVVGFREGKGRERRGGRRGEKMIRGAKE